MDRTICPCGEKYRLANTSSGFICLSIPCGLSGRSVSQLPEPEKEKILRQLKEEKACWWTYERKSLGGRV